MERVGGALFDRALDVVLSRNASRPVRVTIPYARKLDFHVSLAHWIAPCGVPAMIARNVRQSHSVIQRSPASVILI